jgi:tetratricopeptide (TPR) repeat protein
MNKRSWYYCLAFVLLFAAACKNNAVKQEDNPVLQSPQIKELTDKINATPDNAALYFDRGQKLRMIQQDSLALSDFKKAISLDSSEAKYFSAVGDVLFEHKDISGSVQWIEKALLRNPQDVKAQLKLAKLFVYIKEYPKAFQSINTVLKQDVYNAECYFLKGMIYKDLKDTSKAISSFQTAVQMNTSYKDAFIQLGQVYSSKKDPLALNYYDNAYKADPKDVFPLFAKGVYYQDQKNYEAAKAEYRNVVLTNRLYLDAYFNMGYIYMQQDSLEKALRQYNLLTQIDQTNPEAYYNRGLCYELMGKKKEAIDDYKQALVFDEKYPDPQIALKRLGVK